MEQISDAGKRVWNSGVVGAILVGKWLGTIRIDQRGAVSSSEV